MNLNLNLNFILLRKMPNQAHLNETMVSEAPYAYIVEQPAKYGVRFRYECEGRRAGVIPGVNFTPFVQTFPTVAVANFHGPVKVIVSCVTKGKVYYICDFKV